MEKQVLKEPISVPVIDGVLWLAEYRQENENDYVDAGDFTYNQTLRRMCALDLSTDLHELFELNFNYLYYFLVVSTPKYHHIALKSSQFFFEGNR